MQTRCRSFSTLSVVVVVVGALSVAAAGAAQPSNPPAYQIQSLVKTGDPVGDLTIGPATTDGMWVMGLNDQGQVLFSPGSDAAQSNLLAEYSRGAPVPIALPGQDGPGGKWPRQIDYRIPMNLNQRGSVAFNLINEGGASIGIFRWDGDLRQITPVALPGMPAADGLTFTPGAFTGTAINNSNEVAFAHDVKDAAGKALPQCLFFLGRDGVLQVVARPGQALPGVGTVSTAYEVSLNDAGVVGFVLHLTNGGIRLCLWEEGSVTALSSNIAVVE